MVKDDEVKAIINMRDERPIICWSQLEGLGHLSEEKPFFVRDPTLQKALNEVIQGELRLNKNEYAFAVVDLTFDDTKNTNIPDTATYDREKPINDPRKLALAYAGWNDTANLEIASMAKLLPLYAAFKLRSDLRGVFRLLKASNEPSDMAQIIEVAKRGYGRVYTGNLPNIPKIITIEAGKVNFTKVKIGDEGFSYLDFSGIELSDKYLYDKIYHDQTKTNKVKFYEHMRLMTGWSDNYAAFQVIDALGFDYMWALSNRSGLYRPNWGSLTEDDKTKPILGGLCLVNYYKDDENLKKVNWESRPMEAKEIDKMHMANARSIALFMTMLGLERLIDDHEAHVEMCEMLRNENVNFSHNTFIGGDLCPIGEGMFNSRGWTNNQKKWVYGSEIEQFDPNKDPIKPLAASKYGYLKKSCCNTLLIRTERYLGNTLTFVLVGIDTTGNDNDMLLEFGKFIAEKLDARHP